MTFFEEQEGVWSMRRLVAFVLTLLVVAVVLVSCVIAFQSDSAERIKSLAEFATPLVAMGAVALLTFLKE